MSGPQDFPYGYCLFCDFCSSLVDILSVQEMALLSFGCLLLCVYNLLGRTTMVCFSFSELKYSATMAAAMHRKELLAELLGHLWRAKLTFEHGFFLVQLVAYTLWLALHFLIVNVLGQQRLLRDPEVVSYRGSKSLIHVLGVPSILTVATMALTVPILSY